MHDDLRRKALESRKTVSRKARSKQSSASNSRLGSALNSGDNSRSASRVVSRDVSDDEGESEPSEGGMSGTASIDEVLSGAEDDAPPHWQEELDTRIPRILNRNRKNASAAGQEEDLAVYVSILRLRYALSQITHQLPQLYTAFLKSVKEETSDNEKILALEAIAVTTVTDPNSQEGLAYEACGKSLQDAIYNLESPRVKAIAIQALALIVFFSSDDDAVEVDTLPFLLSIIETDGGQVSAEDSPEVVTAALSSWSLLVTLVDDAQDASDQAIDALVDQLSSSATSVQIASGECIALVYEKSWTEAESDEEYESSEDGDEHPHINDKRVQRYEPFRRKDELLSTLNSLTKLSTKSRSKRDRKSLHTSFASIHQSVENPRFGPYYSTAIDAGSGASYGYRMNVKVGANHKMMIDKWWKLIRLETLKRWLKGGFLEHYQKNEVVIGMLPILTRSTRSS